MGTGAFQDSGSYGLAIAMILPLLVAIRQNVQSKLLGYSLLAAIPLSCLTVIGTFERGAFIALMVSLLTYILLQKRRIAALVASALVVSIALLIVPKPEGYTERLATIRTYEEVGDRSAMGRLYFWSVAIRMVIANPLGIGLRNFEPLYDQYDTTDGLYGHERAVHNSHLQVLAENGFLGFAAWLFLFGYSYKVLFRVRKIAADERMPSDASRFYFTVANAFIVSQTAFFVSGSFYSAAHNDLTWYNFGFVAALDILARIEHQAVDNTTPEPLRVQAGSPSPMSIAG
jgi:O-antigen ligase